MNWQAAGPALWCGPYRVGPFHRRWRATYSSSRDNMPEQIGIFSSRKEAQDACEAHQEEARAQWA